jgi:hypothetical protein
MLLQLHPQAIGKFAPHHRLPDPGNRLKRRFGLLQINRKEIARQLGRHVGAQGHRIVVNQLVVDLNLLQGEGGLARQMVQRQAQRHGCKRQQQSRGQGIHQTHVKGAHGRRPPASRLADASTLRQSAS